MPSKNRTAYRQSMRDYLNDLRPPDTTTERGVVGKRAISKYTYALTEAGELLGWAPPRSIPLERMKALDGQVRAGSERTLLQKLCIIRAFLRWCGNKDAFRWRIRITIPPYRGGVFLREHQVAVLHEAAAKLGPTWELIISLAVDMGLRRVDIERLTLDNAEEFLDAQESMILGKGRNGGKIALQKLSKYTRPLLENYLEYRKILVERTGDDTRKLVVFERHHCGKQYLGSPNNEDYSMIKKWMSKLLKLNVGMHDLRRTLGNRLWRLDKKLEVIAKILRHEGSEVTLKAYIGVDSDDMGEALDDLSDAAPKRCPSEACQI